VPLTIVSDARFALRLLRRHPGFSAVAVLVLALAIGVNTAAFGFVDALLFKRLPVRAPDELVRIAASATDGAVSYADYLDYRSARTLADVIAFTADNLEYRATGSDRTQRVAAYIVSDNYFSVLGVDLAMSRGLAAAPVVASRRASCSVTRSGAHALEPTRASSAAACG